MRSQPRRTHFKAAEAALGKSYEIYAYSVFSIGSQNSESELDGSLAQGQFEQSE
jgi:hypothetical protein